jgi:hypothetical protein
MAMREYQRESFSCRAFCDTSDELRFQGDPIKFLRDVLFGSRERRFPNQESYSSVRSRSLIRKQDGGALNLAPKEGSSQGRKVRVVKRDLNHRAGFRRFVITLKNVNKESVFGSHVCRCQENQVACRPATTSPGMGFESFVF